MVADTLAGLYERARTFLSSAFEAGQIFAFVTGLKPQQLPQLGTEPVTPEMAKTMDALIQKRRSGFPLQYLVGEWEFYSLPFQLGEGVLIPRQDTETLVELALEAMKGADKPQILDLCSGCGCIAVTLAHHLEAASVTALEFSETAFGYLERNVALNKVAVNTVLSDLREYTHPAPLDLVVSNPPYVPRSQLATLQEEVAYEPLVALDGGEDGLHYFRAIARRYREQLIPGGLLMLEVGAGQADAVCAVLEENRYTEITRQRDLNHIDRVVVARRPC